MQVLTNLPSSPKDLETSKITAESKADEKSEDFLDVFSPEQPSEPLEEVSGAASPTLEAPEVSELADQPLPELNVGQETRQNPNAGPVVSAADLLLNRRDLQTPTVAQTDSIAVVEKTANSEEVVAATNPLVRAKSVNAVPLEALENGSLQNALKTGQEVTPESSGSNANSIVQSLSQDTKSATDEILAVGTSKPSTVDSTGQPQTPFVPSKGQADALVVKPNTVEATGSQVIAPVRDGDQIRVRNASVQVTTNPPIASPSNSTGVAEAIIPTRAVAPGSTDGIVLDDQVSRITNVANAQEPIRSAQAAKIAPNSTQPSNTNSLVPQVGSTMVETFLQADSIDRLEFQETSGLRRLPDMQSSSQLRPNSLAPLIETVKPDAILNRVSSSLEATIARGAAGNYELKLHPVELGTVRILVSHTEAGVSQ